MLYLFYAVDVNLVSWVKTLSQTYNDTALAKLSREMTLEMVNSADFLLNLKQSIMDMFLRTTGGHNNKPSYFEERAKQTEIIYYSAVAGTPLEELEVLVVIARKPVDVFSSPSWLAHLAEEMNETPLTNLEKQFLNRCTLDPADCRVLVCGA